jgi:hypothetical protein
LVQAKVRTENAVGFSEYSQENNVGVTVQVEPSQVQELSLNYELSTNTQMVLQWSELTTTEEIGDSAILNYILKWNQGSAINVWQEYVSIPATDPMSATVTGLTGGSYY